jgi:DNA-binding response OmpR family regulator
VRPALNKMATLRRFRPDPGPKRRVLVVDDNLDTVESMAYLIKTMGHDVQFALTGFAAVNIASAFRPEIVLLDIGLPDTKGDRIARQIKSERGLENVRIIAISGRAEDEDRRNALAAGCEDYRVKPLDPAVLVRLLEEPQES